MNYANIDEKAIFCLQHSSSEACFSLPGNKDEVLRNQDVFENNTTDTVTALEDNILWIIMIVWMSEKQEIRGIRLSNNYYFSRYIKSIVANQKLAKRRETGKINGQYSSWWKINHECFYVHVTNLLSICWAVTQQNLQMTVISASQVHQGLERTSVGSNQTKLNGHNGCLQAWKKKKNNNST